MLHAFKKFLVAGAGLAATTTLATEIIRHTQPEQLETLWHNMFKPDEEVNETPVATPKTRPK
jgi:hypothetical protein